MTEPELLEIRTQDWGEPVVECLFQRASDAETLSLHVRTEGSGWLLLQRPTEALAVAVQHALAANDAEVRAYLVGTAVGLIIRNRKD